MQDLLVLSNPSRRRRRKHKAKRRASSRRGGRKMSALQRKYFGGGRKRRGRRSVAVLANPVKRRRSSRGGRKARRVRRSSGRSGGMLGSFLKSGGGSLGKPMSVIGPALTGAVGAVAVHAVTARLPLPPVLLVGKTRFITQGAVAIGLGMLASRFGVVGAGVATKMAEGSLTVTLTEFIKEIASDNGINLGGMGVYFPGRQAGGALPSASGGAARMGKYLTGPGARNVHPLNVGRRMGNINTFKF